LSPGTGAVDDSLMLEFVDVVVSVLVVVVPVVGGLSEDMYCILGWGWLMVVFIVCAFILSTLSAMIKLIEKEKLLLTEK
jgi:Kef-type K+ transport system membrane component KefB